MCSWLMKEHEQIITLVFFFGMGFAGNSKCVEYHQNNKDWEALSNLKMWIYEFRHWSVILFAKSVVRLF